jgi:hypothetical protein
MDSRIASFAISGSPPALFARNHLATISRRQSCVNRGCAPQCQPVVTGELPPSTMICAGGGRAFPLAKRCSARGRRDDTRTAWPLFHARIGRGLLVAYEARDRPPVKMESIKPKEEEKS